MGIDGYPLRIVLVSCRSSAISMIYNFAPSATDPRDVILPPTSTASPPPSPSLHPPTTFPSNSRREKRCFEWSRVRLGPLLTYRLLPISYTRNIANRKRFAHRGTCVRARALARSLAHDAATARKIAFAYGADCPVPRVKDLARPCVPTCVENENAALAHQRRKEFSFSRKREGGCKRMNRKIFSIFIKMLICPRKGEREDSKIH